MSVDKQGNDSETPSARQIRPWYVRAALWIAGLAAATTLAGVLLLTFSFAVVYSNLPPNHSPSCFVRSRVSIQRRRPESSVEKDFTSVV